MKIRSMAGTMSRIVYCAVLGLAMVSCYDDSDLRATLDDHEQRLEAIDSNIAALQTLVEAVEDADYIVSVKVIKEDGEDVGYEITFAEHGEIEIYHGTDGKDGKDGTGNGDSIFKEVYESDGFMCFELQDGTTYKIPMTAEGGQSSGLDIIFDVEQGVALVLGCRNEIRYTVTGNEGDVLIRTFSHNHSIYVDLEEETNTTGSLGIMIDRGTDPSEMCIAVSVSDSGNNSVIKSLNININDGVLNVESAYYVGLEAGSLCVPVETNLDYEVVIGYGADWLRHVPQTRSSLRTDEIVFEYDALEGTGRTGRMATVILQDPNGLWQKLFTVIQNIQIVTGAITIDGDFSDWDVLAPSIVSVATCDPDAGRTALKTLKAYAAADAVYIYIEYVDEEIVDRAWTPVHIFLNADGSAETGGYGDEFAEATCEWCIEGAIHYDGEFCSYDGGLYPWTGEVGASGWSWGDSMYAGFTSGAGKDNKYELMITKGLCPDIEWAPIFGLGVDIQQSWESVGILPNAACTNDNLAGHAPLLQVITY